jgi:translation initiation factor 2 subunit 1
MAGDAPREGELVVCSITKVKENGAYSVLDEFPGREGFIFIGEVASGWVKNIRNHLRDGQRVVCKVLRTRKDGSSLELSLKAVSEERRRETLQAWKNEGRAAQLLRVLGEKIGWDEAEIKHTQEEMIDAFGNLYGAFEDAALNEKALEEAGFEGDWIAKFNEIAVENIIPPFVEIRARFEISVIVEQGIEVIRKALCSAEELTDEEADIKVECFYDGAPFYRIEIRAPDYQVGEATWDEVNNRVIGAVEDSGGSASSERF